MFMWYIFEDGYRCAVLGMSANELAWEISRHGKLVEVRPAH